ncbi:MAG: LPS export ABC transporter periplasmic protein LptC [bacterium]
MRSPIRTGIFLCCTFLVLFCSSCEEKIKPAVIPGLESKNMPSQESWMSTIALSDSGRLRALITAGYIRKYESPKITLFSEGVKIQFYDFRGKEGSIMTAQDGRVDDLTNNITAQGNVVVSSKDSTTLYTVQLFWDNRKELIHTPEEVLIVSPTERINGKGFESDQSLKNYKIFQVSGTSKAR